MDVLGLEFSAVSLDLEELRETDPGWWAAGKLLAYARQRQPFIHIDSDVYLWKPLPLDVAEAPVFAQNPERIRIGRSCYNPLALENALAGVDDAWLPEEWKWYRAQGLSQYAPCCGVFGGNDLPFIRRYAEGAMKLIQHPANHKAFETFSDKIGQTILIEQYLLAAYCEFHGVRAGNLFRSMRAAFDGREAAEKGYTHLLAGAKTDPSIAARLEARVQNEYPERYEACMRAAQTFPI